MSSMTKNPYSEKDVSEMFDQISDKYDFLNTLLSLNQDKRWRRKLVEWIPKVNSGTFLDVATGTGDVLIATAKAQKGYTKYLGIDVSKEMLKHAKHKLSQNKIHAELSEMSAERLDFSDKSIDCLTISFGLRNVNNRDRALNHFARALKDDGTLIILEFFLPPKKFLAKLFMFYFRNILPHIGGLFAKKEAYTYLPQSLETFGSAEQIIKQLANKNLSLAHRRPFIFGSCELLVFRKG